MRLQPSAVAKEYLILSWTDRIATEQLIKLRDEFKIKTVVATGTFIGADVEMFAQNFEEVNTMDIEDKYLDIAQGRLLSYDNITFGHMASWEYIQLFIESYQVMGDSDIIMFFLDAHFYDPDLAQKDRWVAVKELQALKGFKNCVIVIHDFDCEGLGHLIYDGEHFGWDVVGEHISKVNPNFHYYTNTREWCDIISETNIGSSPYIVDEYLLDGIRFTNSSDIKRYRGMLYAVPRKLDTTKYRLREYEQARTD